MLALIDNIDLAIKNDEKTAMVVVLCDDWAASCVELCFHESQHGPA
jgi:hypothetical protein